MVPLGIAMIRLKPPGPLGVTNGSFVRCPDSPNCVSTQAEGEQFVAPLQLTASVEDATAAILEVTNALPRCRLVKRDGTYFHFACSTAVCRFIDDLEIWVDPEGQQIHARSSSRLGYSDFGVNGRRVRNLFDQLVAANVARR